jgi:hypothetical protein
VASDYSPAELAYFKVLVRLHHIPLHSICLSRIQVEMIVTAPNSSYCLSSMAALRESQSLKATFTKTHAERVLDTFVARGWLYKSKSVLRSITTAIPTAGSLFKSHLQKGKVLPHNPFRCRASNLHHKYLPERYPALYHMPRNGLPRDQVLYSELRGDASQSLLCDV